VKVFLSETWETTMSFDSGATETKTGALGIELALDYFQDDVFIQPLKMDVPKKTWDEIRKIGVWERIKQMVILHSLLWVRAHFWDRLED